MPNDIDVRLLKGLSKAEVEDSRQKFGANELPESKRHSVFQTAFDVIKEPMFLLLVACGATYLTLGDRQEAMMLLGFVFVVMGITIYQEQKTEKALDALRDLSSPRAQVIRDGAHLRIAGKEVVSGDFVVLSEGDRVPADGVVIWCNNLFVDESLLTGESLHVLKTFEADYKRAEVGAPGGDNTPFVFSGTLIVRGQGIYVVKTVGARTELGKIGKSLETLKPERTSLNKQTGKLVRNLALLGFALFVVVIIVYGLTRDDWVHGLLAGITLAMAMLPEEFPVVLTIFMALGAWRLSKKNVLTRRMPAVETLGAATVLCVDKTGTLTQNRMSVERLYAEGNFLAPNDSSNLVTTVAADVMDPAVNALRSRIPEEFHEVVEYGLLASERDPFDPMEKALTNFGRKCLIKTEHLHDDWKLVEEYALSSKLLALSHVWISPDGNGGSYIVAAKGAPEAILDLCHMEAEGAVPVMRAVTEMAADGLRVLGVARAVSKVKKGLPESQHDFEFSFIGLLGLADPVKQSVPTAITECYKAGIRVVMITGDYPGTAQNVARQIGLLPADMIITGPELSVMGEEELRQRVKVLTAV